MSLEYIADPLVEENQQLVSKVSDLEAQVATLEGEVETLNKQNRKLQEVVGLTKCHISVLEKIRGEDHGHNLAQFQLQLQLSQQALWFQQNSIRNNKRKEPPTTPQASHLKSQKRNLFKDRPRSNFY